MEEHLVVLLVGAPLLGFVAQWLAWRLRIPAILLLLVAGIGLGFWIDPDALLAEVTGGSRQNGPRLLFPVVSLSVALILFEGGLSLRLRELHASGSAVLRLVTLGTLATWALTTAAAQWTLPLGPRMAALLGALLVVTGPTVVGPLLRHIRPNRKVGSIAKWEGIVIDPIGAILATIVFEEIIAAHRFPTAGGALLVLLRCGLIAVVFGFVGTRLLLEVLKRFWLPDYLHGMAFMALALAAFATSNAVQPESGLATITLMGIVLANQRVVSIQHIVEFNENLGVLLISCLFVVLGARLQFSELLRLGAGGLAFVALLIFVIRPAAVLLALVGSPTNLRERLFLSFLAPRGIVAAAVASVFALKIATIAEPGGRLAQQAALLAPVTFLVILGTVAFYALVSPLLARWLDLADQDPQGVLIAGAGRFSQAFAGALKREGITVALIDLNESRVWEAQRVGLAAYRMNILSEAVLDELDLSGIGKLLAMTSNNEVNTLAVREFAPHFGRANVFQTPAKSHFDSSPQDGFQHAGRVLFWDDFTLPELDRRLQAGEVISSAKLTASFTWRQFCDLHGSGYRLLGIIHGKSLTICSGKIVTPPQVGQTVIALVERELAIGDGEPGDSG